MATADKSIEAVPVNRIFLALDNPRHEPVGTEAEAIEKLCAKENVFPLARDIAVHGLNPLERFALIPVKKGKGAKAASSYYAAEGNRRICAVKLLNDPDLAPAKLRDAFEKLSKTWRPISTVPAVLFDDLESVKIWLDRVHSGEQGGIGRKGWSADQKARFDGGNKNKAALALLDYAEAEKLISTDERQGKLTTVQRFLSNDVFREVLGFDQSNPNEPSRTRPKAEFDLLLKRFMRDLVGKKEVNSRMNKDEITKYARPLASLNGVTTTRVEGETLSTSGQTNKSTKARVSKPKKPEKVRHVRFEPKIHDALKVFGNEKLASLYHSICTIELEHHTPIVAVGAWSFFETLTACAGRNPENSFESYFSKGRLSEFGFGKNTSSMRSAVERMQEYGNTTKHHSISATFNGEQLNNDMQTLKELILKCIEVASKKEQ